MSKILKSHDSAWPPENVKDLGSKDAKQEPPASKFNTLAEALKNVKLSK
jgi:hypothetical protein